MIGQLLIGIGSALIGATLAISPAVPLFTTSPSPFTCTDRCSATATLIAIPSGGCGANMPVYRVEWGASTSGVCEGCTVIHHCNNHAKIVITPVGTTTLNGGGLDCADGGVVTATITTCGQAATSQIKVHTGWPCMDVNEHCTVYATIGCKNC